MTGRSWLRRLLAQVRPDARAPQDASGSEAEPGREGRPETASDGVSGPARGAAPGRPRSARGAPPEDPHVRRIVFERTALRRSVLFVLGAVTLWLLALWVFHATAHFLFLLLLAWLIAIAMEPAIGWLQRHGAGRGLASAITGIGGLILVLGVLAIFGAQLAQQIVQLAGEWPSLVANGVGWLNRTFHLSIDPAKITSVVDLSKLATYGSLVAQGAFGFLGTLGSLTFDVLTMIVFAFYFAAGGPRLVRYIASWLPPDQQVVFGTVWHISTVKTGGFVISKLVLILLSTFFHAIFFWWIGLPAWLPLALLTGVTAQLVPLVGTYIGVVAAAVVALFDHPINAVWVVVFATVYQQIESYVFTPRVSNRTMNVNPAIALAAVFVGVALWGPIGAIIGIPVVAVVVAILETYGSRYELVPEIADSGDKPPKLGDKEREARRPPR